MFKWASCNIQLVRLQEKYIVPLYVHSWQCRRQRQLPSHSSVHFALQLHIYRQGSDTFQLLTCALCRSPLSRHCVSEIQIAANAHGLMPLVVQPTINSSPTCNDRNIKQHQGNNKRDPVHKSARIWFSYFVFFTITTKWFQFVCVSLMPPNILKHTKKSYGKYLITRIGNK